MQQGDFASADRLLTQLYGRVSEGADFIDVVAPLAQLLKCHLVGLHFEDWRSHESVLRVSGPARAPEIASLIDDYDRHWQGKNEWLQRGMALMAKHGYGDGDDCVSERELVQIPYYSKFLAPLDIRHGIGYLLHGSGMGGAALLTLNRPRSAGCFSGSERDIHPWILPHLRNAFRISQWAGLMAQRADDLSSTVDAIGVGVVLLAPDGNVLYFNQVAAVALKRIGSPAGPIVGSRLSLDRTTGEWLKDAMAQASRMNRVVGPTVMLSGGDHRRHSLEVLPLGPRVDGHGTNLCLVVRRVDLQDPHPDDQVILMKTFLLTAAEAAVVACLSCSFTPEQVANKLGVSISTVRSHIQHAFVKTGVQKQTDLILLAERVLRGGATRQR